ncbi:MAG: response regulator [Bacteroidia bacterium]
MKVLIVEDDRMLLKALSLRLTEAGHHVFPAADGNIACDVISDQKIELIICDMMMPVLSGLTFLSLLKGYFNKGIPVIVMSTLNNAPQLLTKMDLDYIAFFEKPFIIDELIDLVNKTKI